MIIGALILMYALTKTTIAEDEPVVETKAPLTEQESIQFWADYFGSSYQELIMVAKCESGVHRNPKGFNDGGKAFGLYQFHRGTFDAFSKEMGESLDYYSYNDQAKVAAYAFKQGTKYKSHWTSWVSLQKYGTCIPPKK